jgi:16S rRNA (cytosine1402-N4)-methyltransferase
MIHTPVMAGEAVGLLVHENSRLVLDGTVGCGGHAREILCANPSLRLIGLDRDEEALHIARSVLAGADGLSLVEGNYADIDSILPRFGKVDGVLLDLGISSLQLDTPRRGFSHARGGALDMRMSSEGRTAAQLIAGMETADLAKTLKQYGEISGAGRIARAIRRRVDRGEMNTTEDLRQAVESSVPGKASPAALSRVFQAIRILVNGELQNIERFLTVVPAHVNPGARIVIISYHSLEDRIVKEFFKRESTDCLCPPSIPVCACGHEAILKVLTRRVVKPSDEEITNNPRSRSARLRAAEFLNRENHN